MLELLVAMAITSIVMVGIYSAYKAQTATHVTQERIVEMQQNIRAGLSLMKREIRMAGYDPTEKAGAKVLLATSSSIQFSMDITGGQTDGVDNDHDSTTDEADEVSYGDGDTSDSNEIIRYALSNDQNEDGIADGTPCNLSRATGNNGILQPVANNIDALNFVYLNANNQVISTPVPAADLEDIRTVQVTMVAREGTTTRFLEQKNFTDNRTYRNQQGIVVLSAQNDQVRRIILTSNIYCRNLE